MTDFKDDIQIDLEQAKRQILAYQSSGEFQKAFAVARLVCQTHEDESFFLSAAATMCIKLEQWQEAIYYATKASKIDAGDENNFDILSHAYGALHDWARAGVYGRAALELRHATHAIHNRVLPKLPPIKDDLANKKKIISFSLFGASSAYIEPAVMNVALVQEVYPDWICRFYVDESVPKSAIERLTSPYSEVVIVQGEIKKLPKTMWRFLVMDDDEVGHVMFRDADSVISHREATTVKEWLDSGCRFHTIRDSGSHTELVLAGLWGAMAGSIPNMTQKMYDYVNEYGDNSRFTDQYFLRQCAWAYIQQDLYASDRIFGFMNAHSISDVDFDFSVTHIGCDEGGSIFRAEGARLQKGVKVLWKLYSKIKLSPSFTKTIDTQEERLICQYETVAGDGFVEGHIPRRYANGINRGLSRIELVYL